MKKLGGYVLILFLMISGFGVINAEAGERYLMIGDSYAAKRTGENFDGTTETISMAWPDYVSKKLGLKSTIVRRGPGYGFARPGKRFITLLDSVKPSYSITRVLVAGGIGNDYHYGDPASKADIRSAMKTFDKAVRKRFPHAEIYYAAISWGVTAVKQQYCRERTEWYYSVSRSLGWIPLTGSENALRVPKASIKNYFFDDNIHPNKAGQKRIADAMVKALKRAGSNSLQRKPVLIAEMESTAEHSIKISWNSLKGVSHYVVWGAQAGEPLKKLSRLSADRTSFTLRNLKAGTYYRFFVIGFNRMGLNPIQSPTIYITTESNVFDNHSRLTSVRKSTLLSKGGQVRLSVGESGASASKTVRRFAGIRFISDAPGIAAVSSDGVVRGKNPGTCYIYAVSQSGANTRVRVTVA